MVAALLIAAGLTTLLWPASSREATGTKATDAKIYTIDRAVTANEGNAHNSLIPWVSPLRRAA